MYFQYETNRLNIRVLDESYACEVLNFVYSDKDYFELFEPTKPKNYYSVPCQRQIIRTEYLQFFNDKYLRFYIFKKDNPGEIIGTISFSNILSEPYMSCVMGYKFSQKFQKNGYATEALQTMISAVFKETKIHRIEAYILPDNTPSIKLIEKLGFHYEGVSKELIRIRNCWKDHLRYARINSTM